ncbi:hypothetical protein HIM_00753 [Hirsutella minnesotensis 3608]|nr:hypothetical protein HIM_00753 [Hirsutella minnesotensis 3608]
MTAPDAPESDSDYGYDFSPEEELQLVQLTEASAVLSRVRPALPPARPSVRTVLDELPDKEGEAAARIHDGDYNPLHLATNIATTQPSRHSFDAVCAPSEQPLQTDLLRDDDIRYPDLSRALSTIDDGLASPRPDGASPKPQDHRSPLERFRTFPRKPLSVSDITSGAWCELQYWYTLTRLPGGRRTRTPAMRQGSKVHRELEDQVHETVKVNVATKEDAFALRLWNIITGLRTLRDTGLTRELEVWGILDGNVVNGIIDGLSYENPNPDFEEELSHQAAQHDPKQSTLTDYFPPKKRASSSPKVYLTDVKTRGSLAPVSKALIRPAKIQLLLYHRFLADMASGKLDFFAVIRRYGLRPDEVLSDAFLAQIADLQNDVFHDAPSSPVEPEDASECGQSDAETLASVVNGDLIKYRTLRELVALLIDEIQLAFPEGQDSLGHILRVQYVHRQDGRELDAHDFPVSRQALDAHLDKYMRWWRGERQANGVDIEEAFKCRSCEFVSDCSWRQSMDDERVQGVQSKMRAPRQVSGP